MTIYKTPELDPKVGKEPRPTEPSLDPKPEVAPDAWQISASKKVDDISKHESRHDPRFDPKHGAKPKPEDGAKPGANQDKGGKPTHGDVKK